jgi:hypothetical protein
MQSSSQFQAQPLFRFRGETSMTRKIISVYGGFYATNTLDSFYKPFSFNALWNFSLKVLSRCFLKHYKDYIGEFGHNSQKLSELLRHIKGPNQARKWPPLNWPLCQPF